MNENEYWVSFWTLVLVAICAIAGAIAWTRVKNSPIERDAMSVCIKAGNAWMEGNCVPAFSVPPQHVNNH